MGIRKDYKLLRVNAKNLRRPIDRIQSYKFRSTFKNISSFALSKKSLEKEVTGVMVVSLTATVIFGCCPWQLLNISRIINIGAKFFLIILMVVIILCSLKTQMRALYLITHKKGAMGFIDAVLLFIYWLYMQMATQGYIFLLVKSDKRSLVND